MAIVWNPALTQKESECSCAPCRTFWKRALHSGAERIACTSSERAQDTAVLGNTKGLVQTGDRVVVQGKHGGVVKYVGLADDHLIAPELHVGVSLYENVYSTHNGVYNGKRFFYCPRGHGAMVKYSEITPLAPIPRTHPSYGNSMFPSYEAVKKRRKDREQKIQDAENKLKQEFETRRRAQAERYSKSAPQPRFSPRPTKASKLRMGEIEDTPPQALQDEHDIAYQDYLERERKRQAAPMTPETLRQIQLKQMVKSFGGDEKANRMAHTLQKLYRAYNEGKVVAMAEKE